MKDEQLLSVIFDDAAGFREQLLGDTLRRVRRKRQIRHVGQALLTFLIAALVVWSSLPHRATFNSPPQDAGIQIVHTSRLSAEHLVTTRLDSVAIVSSDKSTLALLGDDQLLDLVPGETKLLVWHAPHQAELIILGP